MNTSRSLLLSFAALALAVACPIPSFADASPDPDPSVAAAADSISTSDSVTVEAPDGYTAPVVSSATKTDTPIEKVPQAISVVTQQLIKDQLMSSMADVMRVVPGVTVHQGENNRDQVILRGNSSSADFFVDGVRDDLQYYRDVYNLDRVEALKGPNAMIFGRGGAGGVVNRVTKEAGFQPIREALFQTGSFENRRFTADFDQPLGDRLAVRINGVYEDSESFREFVGLERWGIAPTLTYMAGEATKLTLSYEKFHDARVADRGISSSEGRPLDVDRSTFFGNPDESKVRADVNLASALLEHHSGNLVLRNRILFGDYDRFYQNFVPGAVSADRSTVLLTAYNNATGRRNLFDQTDLSWSFDLAGTHHTFLAGTEIGRQESESFRNTGYFDGTATSIRVGLDDPTTAVPMVFRQSATDADNHVKADVAALFVQDQIEVTSKLELLAGLRYDRFTLAYHNDRNGDDLERTDGLLSPRAGVVVKPTDSLNLYASYGVSHLPGSGDQFSSLTATTQELEPEKFRNAELGAKWKLGRDFLLTAAAYRLDRTNTRSVDPNDPTRIVQTGASRTDGFELGVSGRVTPIWTVAGGYAIQNARITSDTATAKEGAIVAQVPRHQYSIWNDLKLGADFGAGIGIVGRTAMFAAVDDAVTLPGYTRLDASAYWLATSYLRLQVNVENLTDREYFANADGNTNITPGAPRTFRVAAMLRY